MAHLTGFGIENFKAIKEFQWFDFKNINVITGPNNAGKSALLKSLLLVKNLFNNNPVNDTIDITELDFTHNNQMLGNFTDSINSNSNSDIMTFNLPAKLAGIDDELVMTIEYQIDIQNKLENGTLIELIVQKKENKSDIIKFWKTEKFWKAKIDFIYFRNKLDKETKEKWGNKHDDLSEIDLNKKASSSGKGVYFSGYNPDLPLLFYKWEKLTKKLNLTNETELINYIKEQELKFLNDLPIEIELNYHTEIHSSKSHFFDLLNVINNIKTNNFLSGKSEFMLEEELDEYRNIGLFTEKVNDEDDFKERLAKADNYSYFINSFIINNFKHLLKQLNFSFNSISFRKNSFSNQRIHSFMKDNHSYNSIIHEIEKIGLSKNSRPLAFANNWLKVFGIKDELRIEPIKTFGASVYLGERLIEDYGQGTSQIVFILLEIALIASGSEYNGSFDQSGAYNYEVGYNSSICYLDEPEKNFHPSFQSKFADMVIDANQKFNIQFIIETHSEYLIRKLQYLTAKKEIKPNDTKIYYFHDPENIPKGQKHVKEINILEDGSLSDDFGPGFFDEAINLKLDLLKLKNQKN